MTTHHHPQPQPSSSTIGDLEELDDESIVRAETEDSPSGQSLVEKTDQDLKTFSELLDSITTVDERLKLLWKQIYENALMDRRNAYLIWTDLYINVHGKPEQHVMHGTNLFHYQEIMIKANASLLKLAELVAKAKDAQNAEEMPSSQEIFNRLKRQSTGR